MMVTKNSYAQLSKYEQNNYIRHLFLHPRPLTENQLHSLWRNNKKNRSRTIKLLTTCLFSNIHLSTFVIENLQVAQSKLKDFTFDQIRLRESSKFEFSRQILFDFEKH